MAGSDRSMREARSDEQRAAAAAAGPDHVRMLVDRSEFAAN